MNKPELLCPAGDLERLQMALHFNIQTEQLTNLIPSYQEACQMVRVW